MVKSTVKRREGTWKELLRARDEAGKERSVEAYKKEKGKVKRCTDRIRKEVNGQFGKKIY